MLDAKQFISSIKQIAEEKGIPEDKVIETIEAAIAAAYKKDYGEKGQIIRAKLDPETGDIISGIPPGTSFEDLPENWLCPLCGVRKSEFIEISE